MSQNVLLIDDSPALHRLVEARLQGEAVTLHVAGDGLTGIEMARDLRPDLILLDVEMPAPDGFEVCRRLKLDPALLNIPVIFLTGSAGTRDKVIGLELGAVDYITKPFDPAELRARVRLALRVKHLSDLLATKARVDSVTGLWNQDFFDSRLEAEVSLMRRSGGPVSAILLDIDRFRKLNADHGPWLGDRVLLKITSLVSATMRREDVLCRVFGAGGAELGIICPATAPASAEVLARRLRDIIAAERFQMHNTGFNVSVSFGIAGANRVPRSGLSADGIRNAARRSLETAKRSGLGQICRDEDLGTTFAIATELRALEATTRSLSQTTVANSPVTHVEGPVLTIAPNSPAPETSHPEEAVSISAA